MSDLNLDNIVGFKAVDKDGNEQNVTVDEMVDMVSTRMVMALSETSTFAAVAATGNDVYENELPTVTDAANVRVLQSSGDAAQMTMQSLASKLGELIGTVTLQKNGLVRKNMAPTFWEINTESYIKISMETVYTSASFIISCFSGGTNLLDIINVGAASAATPTCMRVTGGIGNSIYYMDSSGNLFIKPYLKENSWINIIPLNSQRAMTNVELIIGALNTEGLKTFVYK